MKGNIKKLTVFVTVAAIAMFIAVAMGSAANMKIQGIEVTQAIQCFDKSDGYTDCDDNSLELDVEKTTGVRVYVVQDQPCSGTVAATVKLSYLVTWEGGGQNLFYSLEKTFSVPCSTTIKALRDSQKGTANFILTSDKLASKTDRVNTLFLVAEVIPPASFGDSKPDDNTWDTQIDLVPHKTLDVRYMLVDYRPSSIFCGSVPSNTKADASVAVFAPMLMEATFPMPVDVSPVPSLTYTGADIMPDALNFNAVMNLLEDSRMATKPRPDFMFGWLPAWADCYKTWSTWGGSANHVAWGVQHNSSYQNGLWEDWTTLAHEVAHDYLLHVNEIGCSTTISETGYPGFIVTTSGDPWVHSSSTSDYMRSGARNGWISPYDWMSMLGKSCACPASTSSTTTTMIPESAQNGSSAPIANALPEPAVWVSGVVWKDEVKGSFRPVYQLTSEGPFATPDPNGQYCLEFESSTGALLQSHCFNVSFNIGEAERMADYGGFFVELPLPTGTASVVLKREGTELARRSASDDAPVFQAGPTISGTDPVAVSWSTTDADGDPLEHIVQYSPDGGSTWVPIGIRVNGQKIDVDSSALPGGDAAIVRVRATDGFNTTTAMSDAFTVARKSPTVFLLRAPRNNALFRPDDDILFVGGATDPEDGVLKGTSLTWLSGMATLGKGRDLALLGKGLGQGTHEIRLRAVDGDGNTQYSETRTIFVSSADVYASCSAESGEVRLKPGETFEIQLGYSNLTASDVTFTATMLNNSFFEPSHTVDSQVVYPGTGAKKYITYSTAGLSPGADRVIVDVTSGLTGEGILASCDFILRIMTPTTTIVNSAASQYSDTVTLHAAVSPNTAPGSVEFFVDGTSVGTANVQSGVAELNAQNLLQVGSYGINAQFTSRNADFSDSEGTSTLTVTKEDARVVPDMNNPSAVKVNAPGVTAGPIVLNATITEWQNGPGQITGTTDDLGDICLADPATAPVKVTLVPVVGGGTLTAPATPMSCDGTRLKVQATFNYVPVNVYDVTITIGGSYYAGSAEGCLAVYDPSLGFVTGGGNLLHNGAEANFGFTVKYLKKDQAQGSLLYIEHRPTGDVKLKSNSLQALTIVGNSVVGYSAIIIGKATLNGVGNYAFRATVVDNGEPGSRDQFGLQVTSPSGAIISDLTFKPLTLSGGNIQVPHAGK